MDGQTNFVLCDYKSRSTGPLKQHMKSKHNVFNMTIVQVLTQQVERVNGLEREIKAKEQMLERAEVDLNVTKEALNKETEILEEKENALNDIITSQKQKAVKESILVEELKLTKELLTKAHQDLETQTNELDVQLEKEKVCDVTVKTVPKINKVLKVKQEDNIKEKKKEIPCRYFHRNKGCMRGNTCWFYHDENLESKKKSKKIKLNPVKKLKDELNTETKQKNGARLLLVIIDMLKLLLKDKNI